MRLGDLKPGDNFVDVFDCCGEHYGPGVVVDFEEVPEERREHYDPDDWVWTLLDLYEGEYDYNLGIAHDCTAVIEEIEDEPSRVVNTVSFCSCSSPDLKENYAGGNRFFVCRACKKEKI